MRTAPLADIRSASRLNPITPGHMLFKKYVERVRMRMNTMKTLKEGLRRRRSSILANLHSSGRRVAFHPNVNFSHPENVTEAEDRWHRSITLVLVLLQVVRAFRGGRLARVHTFTIDEEDNVTLVLPSPRSQPRFGLLVIDLSYL
jgi:hypothetical protein